jgi:hypothetical protein
MIDSVVFITALIAACTEGVKILVPQISGVLTIVVAAVIGGLVGVCDTSIGIANISVAQGILTGLAAVGVHTLVSAGRTPQQ